MTLPSDSALLKHPLMAHVTTFHGGSNSYLSHIRPRNNSKVLCSWSNGTPLIIEGPVPKKRGGWSSVRSVVLNFYPISSRMSGGNWDVNGDGGHMMLNALVYVAQHSTLKRKNYISYLSINSNIKKGKLKT